MMVALLYIDFCDDDAGGDSAGGWRGKMGNLGGG